MAENSLLDPPLEEGGDMPPMDGEGPLMDFDICSLTMKDAPISWLIEQYNLSTSRRFLDQGTKERRED